MQLHELLSYLNQVGVASFMVLAQYGLLGSAMISPTDVSYLADNVLLLRYFEAAGEVRQAISVMKRRSGPHERSIRELQMSVGQADHRRSVAQFHRSAHRNAGVQGRTTVAVTENVANVPRFLVVAPWVVTAN